MENMRKIKENVEDKITTILAIIGIVIMFLPGSLLAAYVLAYVCHLLYDKVPYIF
ncbi:hypothetical protein [Clostridium perfringens]|uniref:hypothetical protein n=1 Tax=Clostridium perfringens TaxID=1502 RepID=UPI0023413459|nr:hypothetical protein [Clostridium perfringens]MDC4245578.1 hypothetical protein [Clostridium perfringens]